MTLFQAVLVCGLWLFSMSTADAETLVGRASVIDGDTIEIQGERIRVLDVDAPEARQPCKAQDGSEWRCGQKASLALSDWIGTRLVICESTGLDRYRRYLARCAAGGQDVGTWLATSGWAASHASKAADFIRAFARIDNRDAS